MNINWKKTLGVIGVTLGTAFVAMRVTAKKKKAKSVYKNEPEQQNIMKGKKIIFVENENDPINADGKKGHLEVIGESEHFPTVYEKYVKRSIDVLVAFCGFVVLSPVFAATAIAIKMDDPGPALFIQKRVGKDKEYFMLHKFRSMKLCTPHDVPTHMLDNPDQYLLKVGKFIRKYSIDELPQIWDIFIGNMSIIGPRPALWNQDYLTSERDKYNANNIKPGLTGLAQIRGRDELEIEEKAKYDGVYSESLSKSSLSGFLMDVKIFLGSISIVLRSKGLIEGGTGVIVKEFEKIEKL
jgi:O-antigen biosynthesis protein WbqP